MTTSGDRVERRLTAILAADVVGYGQLTSLDEEGTHAQLQDHLRFLVDPKSPRGRRSGASLGLPGFLRATARR